MHSIKKLAGILILPLAINFSCNLLELESDSSETETLRLLGAGFLLLQASSELDSQLQTELDDKRVNSIRTPTQESDAMIELGKNLFFDKVLSGDKNISCATCHFPTVSTGDALPTAIGAGGSGLGTSRAISSGTYIARNSPPLFNLGLNQTTIMFWDGRVSRDSDTGELTTPESVLNGSSPSRSDITTQLTSALAAQAMFPVTSNDEMRGQTGNEIRDAADNEAVWAAIMARLVGTSNGSSGGYSEYRTLFSAAFPDVSDYDDFNFGHAARAIAAFERSAFTAIDSPFDRYLAGDTGALTDDQKLGGLVFFQESQADCGTCHRGSMLSDFNFHSIAAPQLGPGTSSSEDQGRFETSGDNGDLYAFRTSPLRNVELTAPYTHSGAYSSLTAMVTHYNDVETAVNNYDSSQLRSDYVSQVDTDSTRITARLSSRDRAVRNPIGLDDSQKDLLVEFLKSLTDDASRDMSSQVPSSVPSGLSVSD